jgi:hypothetical protein
MSDLEIAINEWRERMLAAGIQAPVPLEELEAHLREEIDRLLAGGKPDAAAFEIAVQQIGRAERLKSEFTKISRLNPAQMRKGAAIFYFGLVGIYTVVAVCGMFKYGLSPREWLAGLAAQAVLLLHAGFMWPMASRFFPPMASRRIQSAIGLIGGISGAVWLIVFARLILPHFDFTSAQLMVAVQWAMVPVLVLPVTSFVFLEKSENAPVVTHGL